MLERLRRTIVETYIGVVALGYLLAEIMIYFIQVFAGPVEIWAQQKWLEPLRRAMDPVRPQPAIDVFSIVLPAALPNMIRVLGLSLIWWFLFRWLYLRSLQNPASEIAKES